MSGFIDANKLMLKIKDEIALCQKDESLFGTTKLQRIHPADIQSEIFGLAEALTIVEDMSEEPYET